MKPDDSPPPDPVAGRPILHGTTFDSRHIVATAVWTDGSRVGIVADPVSDENDDDCIVVSPDVALSIGRQLMWDVAGYAAAEDPGWAVVFGGDGLCCALCESESESWHLMHARLGVPQPQWLCLSCTGITMRREQNRRTRDYPA